VLGQFPYAGLVPRRATGDGRHPKTFTIRDLEVDVANGGFRSGSGTCHPDLRTVTPTR
jgi:hypothetical protein